MKVRLIDELTLQRELFCQIQQNAIDSCSIHYDSYKNWCLSGLEVEKAINDIFSKSGPFASTIGPETLPVVQELRKELERVTAERDSYKIFFEDITKCGDCNDCGKSKTCEFVPKVGQTTRYNCPLWTGR